MSTPHAPPPPRTSDHLANERTFLAWVRTSISVTGLGFVVARFGVWLRQLSASFDAGKAPVVHHTGLSLPLGVTMMAAGAVVAVVAAYRYSRVRRAIDLGMPAASRYAVVGVTVGTVGIIVALMLYMVATG
jgi:putative membrane protein